MTKVIVDADETGLAPDLVGEQLSLVSVFTIDDGLLSMTVSIPSNGVRINMIVPKFKVVFKNDYLTRLALTEAREKIDVVLERRANLS